MPNIKLFLIFILAAIYTNAFAEQHRSQKAKSMFKHSHPCPVNGRIKGSCRGYIIDHIKPLACGGADGPENVLWQTKADAKAKDKWELKGC